MNWCFSSRFYTGLESWLKYWVTSSSWRGILSRARHVRLSCVTSAGWVMSACHIRCAFPPVSLFNGGSSEFFFLFCGFKGLELIPTWDDHPDIFWVTTTIQPWLVGVGAVPFITEDLRLKQDSWLKEAGMKLQFGTNQEEDGWCIWYIMGTQAYMLWA